MKPVTRPREPIGIKPLYTPRELAHALGISRYRLLRMMEMQGVALQRIGKSIYVPLSEIQDKVPPLWASLLTSEKAHRDVDCAFNPSKQ